MVVGDLRDLLAELPLPRPDDQPANADAVRIGDRSGVVEVRAQVGEVEVRVEGQFLCDHERCDEHDARASVGGEAAREIEPVLGLGSAEERHDDVAVADGPRAPGKAAEATPRGKPDPHRRSWYGTLVRTTFGSKKSSRLMYRARWLWSARRQPRVTSSGMSSNTVVSPSAVSPRR